MAKRKLEIENETQDGEISLVLVVPQARMLIDEPQEAEMQAVANELLAKYPADFQIKTKADYENLKADLRKTVKMRTQTDEWRKSIKRVADEVSDKIQRLFDPAEKRMASIKKQYDDAEAERLRLEKEAREKLIKDRTAAIYALGGTYNGSAYVLGDVEIFPEDLPSDGFEAKMEAMKAERVRIDEEERLRKIEADRLAKEELERQRLAKEAAEKLAEDNARIEAENQKLRDQLAALAAEKEKPVEVPVAEEPPREGIAVPPVVHEKFTTPIIYTIDRDAKKYGPIVTPPVVTTPSGKVIEVPREMLADDVAPPVVTPPETATTSIIPTDLSERETFLAGAKAAFGMAKREFPDITPAQWRDCWKRFQEM